MTQPHPIPSSRERLRLGLGFAVLAGLLGLAGSVAGFGDKIPPDPVKEFEKALEREKTGSLEARRDDEDGKIAREAALKFRRAELKRTSDKLTTLDDIARALLLFWPSEYQPGFEEEARKIDEEFRRKLLNDFDTLLRAAFKSGTPQRQAAAALLAGETAAVSMRTGDPKALRRTRADITQKLDQLTPELVALTSSKSASVRGAAARALGLMPRRPYTAAKGLDNILATDRESPANRRAAANSLGLLVQATTGADLLPRSEPNVRRRETPISKTVPAFGDKISVLAAVTPVAGRGLGDSDVLVRRQSASALLQVTAELARELKEGINYIFDRADLSEEDQKRLRAKDLKDLPSRDRKDLSPLEKARIARGREEIRKFEEQIKPVIAALTVAKFDNCTVPEALVKAAGDPDLEVRLGVRQTFAEMARVVRFINDLRDLLPHEKPEKLGPPMEDKNGKGKKKEVRLPARSARLILVSGTTSESLPVLRLPPPPRYISAEQDDKKDEKLDRPKKEEKDIFPDDAEVEKNPYKDLKLPPDILEKTLVKMGQEVIRRGATDPNPAGRRAALEAIEVMGDQGKVFVPRLIESLKDRDRFVRWIAARALGKLAPRLVEDNLRVASEEVVPALVCLLDEVDLDVRLAVIEALGQYNSTASKAVPALAARLGKGDAESRLAMLTALERIGAASVAALPSIRPLLTASDPRLRAEGARMIGLLARSVASEYLPDLQKLLRDPDVDVRKSASAAIIRLTDK
jgi:HEAT repeat protein